MKEFESFECAGYNRVFMFNNMVVFPAECDDCTLECPYRESEKSGNADEKEADAE